MKLVQYNQACENMLDEVAEEYGVEREKLWDLYLEIMRSNYEQDLCEIARENEAYLKGESDN